MKSFTLGLTLTPRDVRSIVVATLLETEGRVEREDPGKLLARWLLSEPLRREVLPLLGQVLEEAFGLPGALLSRGLAAGAARHLAETEPAVLKRLLAPAEAAAHRHQLRGREYPLLAASLELELGRLARFAGATWHPPATLAEWAGVALTHACWAAPARFREPAWGG